MSKLVKEVFEITDELLEGYKALTKKEALDLAVKIQYNRVFSDAFLLGKDVPSALEAIAMELGASADGSSIKDALYLINGK